MSVGEEIEVVGLVVSITNCLLAERELVAPGATKVRVALLFAESLIVPLFKARAEVEE